MNNKQKSNKQKQSKKVEKNVKACFQCGSVKHLVGTCPQVKAQVAKAVAQKHAPANKPLVSAAKAGREIIRHAEKSNVGGVPALRRAIREYEGTPSMSGRHRHGSGKWVGSGRDKHGAHDVYEFEYRVDVIEMDDVTPPGTVLVRLPLHTSTLGPVAEEMLSVYTMFLIESVKGCYDSEIAMVDPEARGALYMAYNTNANVVIPYGSDGPRFISTWEGNFMPCPLKRANDVEFSAKLALDSQVPRYIAQQSDDQWDTQGVFVVIAATTLDTSGAKIELGEFYLKSRVRVYTLAVDSEDINDNVLIGSGIGEPAAKSTWDTLGNYVGSKDMVYFPPVAAGALGEMVFTQGGTYTIEIDSYIDGVGQAASNLGSLTYFAKADQPLVRQIGGVLTTPYTNNGTNIVFTPTWCTSAVPTDTTYCTYVDTAGTVAQVGAGKRIIKLIYAFWCAPGSLFVLVGPTYTGQSTGSIMIRWTRIWSDYLDFGDSRVTPQTSLESMRPDYQVIIAKATQARCCEPTESQYMSMMKWIVANGSAYPAECNEVIRKLDLPLPMFATTSAMPPVVGAVVLWAIEKFGPMLAKSAMDWVCDRIDGGKRVSDKRRKR